MKHSISTGRSVNPSTPRRSYHARQKTLLIRFMAASVFVHLAVLALPGWPVSAPILLVVPSLQISLQHTAVLDPISAVETQDSPRQSSAAPLPVAFKPQPAHTGPVEPGVASSASSNDAERLNHLQTLLRGALDRQFVYPPLARRHGWQGKVELSAELDANGRLQNMRVLRSSGFSILDEDALSTLARIGELPQARHWLSGRGFRIALPVVYRLVEG